MVFRRLLPAAAILGIVAGGALFARNPILRATGSAMVADDPVTTADIIVVAVGSGGSGVLEAADLVRAGVAPRVAYFREPLDEVDAEFARRGVARFGEAEIAAAQLRQLGVERVERIPVPVEGTESESRVLPEWCVANGIRSLVVVTTPDHSRRLRRVLRRSIPNLTVFVRAARYSTFDPDRWWRSRAGLRTGITEAQKLLLDVVRHPLG